MIVLKPLNGPTAKIKKPGITEIGRDASYSCKALEGITAQLKQHFQGVVRAPREDRKNFGTEEWKSLEDASCMSVLGPSRSLA